MAFGTFVRRYSRYYLIGDINVNPDISNAIALKDEGDEVVKALVFQLERNLGDSSKDPRTM